MIASKDRSGWIGASDTDKVMGNWQTPTWHKWWAVKLGITTNNVSTTAMLAGTYYEHRILDALGIKKRDRQIKLRRLRLRVNLDGEDAIIHEVKTHKSEEFKLSKAYWQQAQVEMYAAKKPLVINAYRLTEAEYENFFLPIDKDRLTEHPVEYDEAWIKEMYLPRLRILATCLKKGVFPIESIRQNPARRK
jgi:hypothetical protein